MPPDDPGALARLLRDAARGVPPAPDGSVTVLGEGGGHLAALLAFANHHVVVADVPEAWVRARLAPGDLSAPTSAPFLDALAGKLGRTYDNLDLVLAAEPLPDPPPLDLVALDPDPSHPRVARSLRYRRDVATWETADGAAVLMLGRGLAGRWEVAFEVDPSARGRGLGRALATAARHLVPDDEPLFIQIAPGNVPSLKAILASGGWTPIGGEVLYPEGSGAQPG